MIDRLYYYYDYYYYMNPVLANFIYALIVFLSILIILSLWKIFEKAGQGGWKCLIPFYNVYTKYKIIWGNGWIALLLIIPVVSTILYFITAGKMARVFGKGFGFTLGLIFFPYIFQFVLGFGRAQYQGIY